MSKLISILLSRFVIFISLLIFSIIFIDTINERYNVPELYNGNIFLFDATVGGYVKTIIVFAIIAFGISYINKKYAINNLLSKVKKIKICITLFALSFMFKTLLHDLSLTYPISQTDIINNIFINETFNYYKLYSYLVFLLHKISSNYEIYLGLINIILGSLIPVLIYLISNELKQNHLTCLLISTLTILFMPLNALESVYRVDLLYLFLFILSIYLTLIVKTYNSKSFMLLLITLILCCLAREQTIYLLPLYIFYFFFNQSSHRFLMMILIIAVTVPTSLSISQFNQSQYGASSFFRDGHLVIKLIQYGYLSNHFSPKIMTLLNSNEIELFSLIDQSYQTHVLPHKRENFTHRDLSHNWYLIKPDKENLAQKNHRSINGGDLGIVKNRLLVEIDKLLLNADEINPKDIKNLTKRAEEDLLGNDKRMIYDIESILINDVINDKTTLSDLKLNKKYCKNSPFIDVVCLRYIISQIDQNYLFERSDLWFLKKAGLYDFALKYDSQSRKYFQPDNIHLVKNILSKKPELYIIQSILTLTSMSGYLPVPVNLGGFSKKINNSIISNFITVRIQKIYYLMINLWYILCLISLVYFFSCFKDRQKNINFLFISIIPLYYGLFLSFSTFNEFSRLMLPVIPFIFMSFISLISYLVKSD